MNRLTIPLVVAACLTVAAAVVVEVTRADAGSPEPAQLRVEWRPFNLPDGVRGGGDEPQDRAWVGCLIDDDGAALRLVYTRSDADSDGGIGAGISLIADDRCGE